MRQIELFNFVSTYALKDEIFQKINILFINAFAIASVSLVIIFFRPLADEI